MLERGYEWGERPMNDLQVTMNDLQVTRGVTLTRTNVSGCHNPYPGTIARLVDVADNSRILVRGDQPPNLPVDDRTEQALQAFPLTGKARPRSDDDLEPPALPGAVTVEHLFCRSIASFRS